MAYLNIVRGMRTAFLSRNASNAASDFFPFPAASIRLTLKESRQEIGLVLAGKRLQIRDNISRENTFRLVRCHSQCRYRLH
jgi:hypothetical protein